MLFYGLSCGGDGGGGGGGEGSVGVSGEAGGREEEIRWRGRLMMRGLEGERKGGEGGGGI